MNTVERIKQTSTPQDALVVLAHALDAIWAEIQELKEHEPVDAWAEWEQDRKPGADGESLSVVEPEPSLALLNMVAIDDIKHRLGHETDADERRALEAQLSLLQDEGAQLKRERRRGTELQGDDDHTEVVLPPVSEETQAERRKFAENIGLSDDEAETYALGGPLWLYYGDRERVMQLPVEWRRQMVREVQAYSPDEAREMGRDVLKDEGPGNSEATKDVLING